jgi:hypothetical protein
MGLMILSAHGLNGGSIDCKSDGVDVNKFMLIALGLLCCGVQPKAQDSQKETPKIYYVTGTGWQTCSDWKDEDSSFKFGYLVGHIEGVTQLVPLSADPNIKKSFDVGSGLKYGDYISLSILFVAITEIWESLWQMHLQL